MKHPPHYPLTRKKLINDFAIRSFRDVADEDYIAARSAFRAGLPHPALWLSQQAVEKYLKCILLLNRIKANNVGHSLNSALNRIEESKQIKLELMPISMDFLKWLDGAETSRYFEESLFWKKRDLFLLDRLVWELRRFCTLDGTSSALRLEDGTTPPRYHVSGGRLEEIMRSNGGKAREELLWKNGYWGDRATKSIRFQDCWSVKNSPLYMHPEIIVDLIPFVHFSKKLIEKCRKHTAPGYTVPPDTPED